MKNSNHNQLNKYTNNDSIDVTMTTFSISSYTLNQKEPGAYGQKSSVAESGRSSSHNNNNNSNNMHILGSKNNNNNHNNNKTQNNTTTTSTGTAPSMLLVRY